MTGKEFIVFALTIFLNVCVCAHISAGQDVEITSVLSATKVSLNDQLILTVSVSGPQADKAGEPELEPMPEFSILGSSMSTNIEIINFKTSVTKSYNYVLVPKKVGVFDVGAASVRIGGKKLSASTTKVEVVQGVVPQTQQETRKTQTDDNIFIKTSVDKKEVYVGEQVTLTFEFYNRLSITEPEYTPPTTTGFWQVELPKILDSGTFKIYGSKRYYYYAIKTALFPITSGELTIGSASLTYTTTGGFFPMGETRSLQTDPIRAKVKPLPEQGKPVAFNGAVGNYTLTAKVENTAVKAGEVVTVHVSVTGQGNLDLVTSVTEPDLSSFKTYPPKMTETLSNSGFVVGGAKSWDYVIVPKQQGKVTVPPFSLTFFNPGDTKYHNVSTQPIELTVLPGDAAAYSETGSGVEQSGVRKIATDIRFIKPDKKVLVSTNRCLYESPAFYLVYGVPLALFVSLLFVKRRQDAIERNTGLKRKLNAWKHTQRRLSEAEKMLNASNVKNYCGKLHECITHYVCDMVNIDAVSLTFIGLEKLMKEKGIPSDLAERVKKTLELCDFVRFASMEPDESLYGNILEDTKTLLGQLREQL